MQNKYKVFLLAFVLLSACKEKESSEQPQVAESLAISQGSGLSFATKQAMLSVEKTRFNFSENNLTETIIVKNDGDRVLVLSNVILPQNNFIVNSKEGVACKTDLRIEPQQFCTVNITYQPQEQEVKEMVQLFGRDANAISISLIGAPKSAQQTQSEVQVVNNSEQRILQAQIELSKSFASSGGSNSSSSENPYLTMDNTPQATRLRSIGTLDGRNPISNNMVVSPSIDNRKVVKSGTTITLVTYNEVQIGQQSPVRAMVSYPVYGGYAPSRKRLEEPVLELIPVGTMFEGTLSTFSGTNSRLNIALESMVTPTGQTVFLSDSLYAHSSDGSSGVVSRTDHRYAQRYAPQVGFNVLSAVVLSESGDVVISSGENTDFQSTSGRTRALNQLADDLNKLGQRVTEDYSNVQPRFFIPKGTEITVSLTHKGGGLYFVSETEIISVDEISGRSSSASSSTEQGQ